MKRPDKPVLVTLLTIMIAFACNGNPVEESEVVAQLQADVEDLKGMFASMKTFVSNNFDYDYFFHSFLSIILPC